MLKSALIEADSRLEYGYFWIFLPEFKEIVNSWE